MHKVEYIELSDREQAAEAVRQLNIGLAELIAEEEGDIPSTPFSRGNGDPHERMNGAYEWMFELRV